MNTLKTVYGKLFKEETKLASHEVYLGALQEIEKDLITASAGAIKAIDMAKAAIKPAQTSLPNQNFTRNGSKT